ncbi:hypothetical protein [uncultured Hymenobacter sp.]|uniref:hypothetical protein n=1 Tax=uncultured Hymenobacter sp. TaxID=170016 RepID=UPI0035CB8CF4
MPRVFFSGLLDCLALGTAGPRRGNRLSGLLLALLLGTGCSPQRGDPARAAAPLGTGHFEGSVRLKEGSAASFKLVLELRHPRAGHYEAEVLAPTRPGLSFVADSVDFQAPTLRLTRPGQPSQRLALTREGDFWRGTLTLDSAQAPVLLLRRGTPAPATYRVSRLREPALGAGPLLFAPADETMAGPALALLPAPQHAALALRWADALARAGVIVLLLPPPADTAADLLAAQAALRQLRATPGADTARLGVWATAGRAASLAAGLPGAGPPQPNFLVLQQLANSRALRPSLRQLPAARSVLGLYDEEAPGSRRASAALRAALPQRQGHRVRVVPAAAAGAAVADWLSPAGD